MKRILILIIIKRVLKGDLVEGKKILGESLFDYYWINLSQG